MSPVKSLFAATVLVSCCLFSQLSFASSQTGFTNDGGKLTGSNSGLSLSGSVLVAVDGYNGGGLIMGNNLGSVSFTTGALTSGSLQKGGTFAGGGSFIVTSNGSNGLPNGTLFSGTFTGPVSWTMLTLANGTHNYTLSGEVSGMIGTTSVDGTTIQLTINTGKGWFNGSSSISSGDTNVTGSASVPEPSTLSLLGTGALGVIGMLRKKAISR